MTICKITASKMLRYTGALCPFRIFIFHLRKKNLVVILILKNKNLKPARRQCPFFYKLAALSFMFIYEIHV